MKHQLCKTGRARYPVPGIVVSFEAPDSGPKGVFSNTGTRSTTATTTTSGMATASSFTANQNTGPYYVIASVGGTAATATFSARNALWFVATGGNDSNSCYTPAAPCATIQAAIDKAQAGDIVTVAQGTYTNTNLVVRELAFLLRTLQLLILITVRLSTTIVMRVELSISIIRLLRIYTIV